MVDYFVILSGFYLSEAIMAFKRSSTESLNVQAEQFKLMLKAVMLISHKLDTLTEEIRVLSAMVNKDLSQEEVH